MIPKPIKQSLKYNSLLIPKEHKDVIQLANFELWGEVGTINLNYPNVQIIVDHVVKEFGNYYGIDLKLKCRNKNVQRMLDAAYERTMRLPRFEKHEHFEAMVANYCKP